VLGGGGERKGNGDDDLEAIKGLKKETHYPLGRVRPGINENAKPGGERVDEQKRKFN